jgi:hypothetical protein
MLYHRGRGARRARAAAARLFDTSNAAADTMDPADPAHRRLAHALGSIVPRQPRSDSTTSHPWAPPSASVSAGRSQLDDSTASRVDWRARQPSPPRPNVPTDVLSDEQLKRYHRDGCLLVSGLLSEEVAERAERTMWALCGLDPAAPPEQWLAFGRPAASLVERGAAISTVDERGLLQTDGLQNADLMACATDRYLGAMAQLLGVPPSQLHPPQSCHAQNLLPRPGGERPVVHPHVDGIPREHNHSVFPGPFNVTSLIYLNDTMGEEGGGTRVWPGSASKIRALAESDLVGFEKLWRLTQDIPSLDLGEPVQLVPKRGDVLFWSHLLGHNGTPNTGERPRMCMRFFCSCDACFRRWKKSDAWGHWAPYGESGKGPFD